MSDLNVILQGPAVIYNQPFDAIDLDGKPVTVWGLACVADREKTLAVSVPPTGAGRWMCLDHKQLFRVGKFCPVCTGADTDIDGVSRVVTPVNSDEIVKEVN